MEGDALLSGISVVGSGDRTVNLAARLLTTRWLVRLPIGFYRAGFGWLFGPRLMMLEHRGRVSGEWRAVVLEVVDREPSRRSFVVASGFGTGAQWYRNLVADPRCRISTGTIRQRDAVADLLSAEASREGLERYAQRNPHGWKVLHDAIVEVTGDKDPDVPLVRLTEVGMRKGRR